MSGGVEQYFPIIRKLLIGDCCSAMDSILYCFVQIINGEVEMGHLLLGFGLLRPYGRYVVGVPLK